MTGDKIFVSDYRTHTITCLKSDADLIQPQGMLALLWYVVGRVAPFKLEQQLERNTELLTDDDDISGPYCVAFSPKDVVIVVGGYENNKLFLYQISDQV